MVIDHQAFFFVGMRRFELPTPRPPDAYSNLAELHPELFSNPVQKYKSLRIITIHHYKKTKIILP